MATLRQRKAVDRLVENGGNVTRAMIDTGYSLATANSPTNLTESKGYKEILEEHGLTEGLVIGALVTDIKKKPQKRFNELSLGAELLQLKKPQANGITYNTIIISDEQSARIARRALARLQRSEGAPN